MAQVRSLPSYLLRRSFHVSLSQQGYFSLRPRKSLPLTPLSSPGGKRKIKPSVARGCGLAPPQTFRRGVGPQPLPTWGGGARCGPVHVRSHWRPDCTHAKPSRMLLCPGWGCPLQTHLCVPQARLPTFQPSSAHANWVRPSKSLGASVSLLMHWAAPKVTSQRNTNKFFDSQRATRS